VPFFETQCMLSALYAIAGGSVRLSVRRVYHRTTVEVSPYGSPHPSSFCGVSFIQKF